MKTKKGKVMNIAIILLSIIVVMLCITFIQSYKRQNYRYYSTEDSYLYYIGEKKYYELARQIGRVNLPDKPSDTLLECIAVVNYYKDASIYKMYKEIGSIEKAQKHYSQMEENLEQMGELSYVAEEINEELGIQ